jgi:hypothetical protein
MDLGFLMSDPPVRGIKINLLLARINICVSYSLVIFGVDRQHDGEKDTSATLGVSGKRKEGVFKHGSYRGVRVAFADFLTQKRQTSILVHVHVLNTHVSTVHESSVCRFELTRLGPFPRLRG